MNFRFRRGKSGELGFLRGKVGEGTLEASPIATSINKQRLFQGSERRGTTVSTGTRPGFIGEEGEAAVY